GGETPRQLAQHRVSGGAPPAPVDPLQAVGGDDQHRQTALFALRLLQAGADPPLQFTAVVLLRDLVHHEYDLRKEMGGASACLSGFPSGDCPIAVAPRRRTALVKESDGSLIRPS